MTQSYSNHRAIGGPWKASGSQALQSIWTTAWEKILRRKQRRRSASQWLRSWSAPRIVQCLSFLNLKFQVSNHLLWLYSPVCVGPGGNPNCWFSHAQAHVIMVVWGYPWTILFQGRLWSPVHLHRGKLCRSWHMWCKELAYIRYFRWALHDPLYSVLKHRLWVFVRTFLARWFKHVPTKFWEKIPHFQISLYLSRIVRKPDFCLGENKGADQLRGNREADQRLCFRYSDSTIPLLPICKISSF